MTRFAEEFLARFGEPLPRPAKRRFAVTVAAQLHQVLTDLSRKGEATPQDTQLLAALDRWSAGDLT